MFAPRSALLTRLVGKEHQRKEQDHEQGPRQGPDRLEAAAVRSNGSTPHDDGMDGFSGQHMEPQGWTVPHDDGMDHERTNTWRYVEFTHCVGSRISSSCKRLCHPLPCDVFVGVYIVGSLLLELSHRSANCGPRFEPRFQGALNLVIWDLPKLNSYSQTSEVSAFRQKPFVWLRLKPPNYICQHRLIPRYPSPKHACRSLIAMGFGAEHNSRIACRPVFALAGQTMDIVHQYSQSRLQPPISYQTSVQSSAVQ